MLLQDYNVEDHRATIQNSFPILCVDSASDVVIEHVIVEGNKATNAYLDGCRGGAIYLYHSTGVVIRNCVARNYNGDGISFQITDDVHLLNCESHGNTGYGIHPGAGSLRSKVKGCRIHDNGDTGLFLCWRVCDSRFEDNVIEKNGKFGISIGHKDTDNQFVDNEIRENGIAGVYFRKETLNNSGHRNSFFGNKILNNGSVEEGFGFYIEPMTSDLVISKNEIADTRSGSDRTQRFGIYKVAGVGQVTNEENEFCGQLEKNVVEAGQQR
jgi:hypothetical protein